MCGYKLHKMNWLCSMSKKWIYQKTMSINPQSMHIATILTNTHSIIKNSMHIMPGSLLVGFSSPKTFTFQSMPPSLSFCAEPNGEVAESIIQKLTLTLRERGDCRRCWERAREEPFPLPLLRPGGHLLPREKVVLHKVRQWILQLRASPSCRIT